MGLKVRSEDVVMGDGSVLTFDRIRECENKIDAYMKNKRDDIFDPFYRSDISVIEEGLELLKGRLTCCTTKEQWLSTYNVDIECGKACKEVLIFIANILFINGYYSEEIRTLFASGRCYHFAVMLKDTFQRGRVVVAGPYSHVVWEDVDGCTYDIDGVNKEYEFLVPIEELTGRGGFDHRPTSGALTSQEEYDRLRNRYMRPTFGYGANILMAAATAPANKDAKYGDSNRDLILTTISRLWDNAWMRDANTKFPIKCVKEISVTGKFVCGYSFYEAIDLVIIYDSTNFGEYEKHRADNAIEDLRSALRTKFNLGLNVAMIDGIESGRFNSTMTMWHEWHEVLYPVKQSD